MSDEAPRKPVDVAATAHATGFALGKALDESDAGKKLSGVLGGAPASLALGVFGKMLSLFLKDAEAPDPSPANGEPDPKSLAAVFSNMADGAAAGAAARWGATHAPAPENPLIEEAKIAKAALAKREKRARRRGRR